jgi:hypothetical protein
MDRRAFFSGVTLGLLAAPLGRPGDPPISTTNSDTPAPGREVVIDPLSEWKLSSGLSENVMHGGPTRELQLLCDGPKRQVEGSTGAEQPNNLRPSDPIEISGFT